MSQVIPNHVLRVGQSVSLTSKEDSGGFQQTVHPRCISMTSKYTYFGTERCVGQIGSPINGYNGAIYGGENHLASNTMFRGAEEGPQGTQSAQQVVPEWKTTMKQTADKRVIDRGEPISPTLDVSIDTLNKLIFQLDPTFQPLPIKTEQVYKSSTHSDSPCRPENFKTTSPPDIKCVDLNTRRARCEEVIPCSSSPTPRSEGILISRGTHVEDYPPNGSVIFSETSPHTSGHVDHHHGPSFGGYHQATEGIAIPRQKSYHSCQMSTSLGSETMQKAPFRISDASIMSNSPGSDTSYRLGSTHSLLHDDIDPFRSLESFSNLNSPAVISPSSSIHYFDQNTESCSPNITLPGLPNLSKAFRHTPTKGHANSCPPSVAGSSMDIPILLVNGCLESEDSSSKSSKSFHGHQRRSSSSSFNRVNKTYSDSSISTSSEGSGKDGQPGMKSVMASTKHWFKPSLTRDKAIEYIKDKEPGTFVIRDSTSFRGSFGLAMKVPGLPSKTAKETNELVRHFLIESSAKGVHIKGAPEEPYFGSLSALVYQHTITPLSLPCKLFIPDKDQHNEESIPDSPPGVTSAACNVLYLNSVSTETLTGSSAIQKAVSATFERSNLPMLTIVHFKANEQGVTLTDVQRKVFFRRHYPLSTLSFCSVDPELRKWQKQCKSSRIFGFVAKNPTDPSDNVCHVFAEYDVIQPVSPLISFLTNLIQQQEKA
ncbi:tensin-4 [Spea bombifrons]|uniref:tensin-4 n=1 Tax=Spea bombifrons TaxID=233779 RepID=UPI00234A3E21|nr:tensin-4 [Spea bombifrons]